MTASQPLQTTQRPSPSSATVKRSDRDLMPPPPPKKRRAVTPPQSPQTQPPPPSSPQSVGDDETVGQRNYGEEGYWEDRYRRQLEKARRRDEQQQQQQQQQEERKSAANDEPEEEEEDDDDDDVTSEWYYDWKTLTPLLDITPSMRRSSVLDLGCGLSALFADLIADGFTGPMLGIDSAPSVLTEQRSRFPAASYPNVSFSPRSLFSTAYLTASPSERHRYGLIVDKATSDGIMCASQATHTQQGALLPIIAMYRMVGHCLAPGGTFVCVSVQEPDSGWCRELMMAGLIEGAEGQSATEERKDSGYVDESSGGRRWGWRVDVHSIGGEGEAEYYDGEKEGPNVYIIQKLTRERRSRAAKRAATSDQSDDAITISRHFH